MPKPKHTHDARATLDETRAREVLMVRAFEEGSDGSELRTSQWTAEDRAWATRLARQTSSANAANGAAFIADRAHHALQRLRSREPGLERWLAPTRWKPGWCALAALLGLIAGVLVDQIGNSQRINLLAPPVWAVVAWNLAVYVVIVLGCLRFWPTLPTLPALSLRRGVQRWLQTRASASLSKHPVWANFVGAWTTLAAPLNQARAASLLHIAAAALALGLVAGLYLRGLVLDYRAGWQSTFLDAAQVQTLLGALLDVASRVSGIGVPAVAPLRVTPELAPSGAAAPWLHLYATTLALWVIVPRCLLAAWALWQARSLARAMVLPWQQPYFAQLLRAHAGSAASAQVWPHGAVPDAQAALGLRAVLARHFGEEPVLRIEAATAYGDEDVPRSTQPGATAVCLFDLASTPEVETHGRFIEALQQAGPVIVVTNEASFLRRFLSLQQRLAQRRAAWGKFCDERGVQWLSADLEQPL